MSDEKSLQQKFVEAWGAVENPEMDGSNPHFGNTYATLKSTLKSVREACRPLGIVYLQVLTENDGENRLKSFVMDGTGSIELSTFPVAEAKTSQAFGSELTYKKRQQAQADWGITGEVDEDGEAITAAQSKPGRTQRKVKKPSNEALARVAMLKQTAIDNGVRKEGLDEWYSAKFKNAYVTDLDEEQVQYLTEYLETMVRDSAKLKNGEQE